MKKVWLFAVALSGLLLGSGTGYAQGLSQRDFENLKKMEDSLVVSADSMYEAFIPDTRIEYSERFARQLVRALKIPNSYQYPFDTLQKVVNFIKADDDRFRIINWGVEPGNIPKRYYGAIQMNQPTLKLIGLNDYSDQVSAAVEDSILTGGKWFGAFYYRIMSREALGKHIYMLLGVNTSGALSDRKIIDPMYFDTSGKAVFGAPVFAVASRIHPQQKINRFVLEYKKNVAVSMNWDAERNLILFDHLVSISNDPSRRYTYVPSGQYDGLIWDGNEWHVRRDLVAVKILEDGQAPDE